MVARQALKLCGSVIDVSIEFLNVFNSVGIIRSGRVVLRLLNTSWRSLSNSSLKTIWKITGFKPKMKFSRSESVSLFSVGVLHVLFVLYLSLCNLLIKFSHRKLIKAWRMGADSLSELTG